jgi:signal transduction histidine kinase
MVTRSFSSLRVRLLILVLMAVLPALGLVIYTNIQQRRAEAVKAQENALRLARLAAENQAQLVAGAHQILVVLAQLPYLYDDPVACHTFLAGLLEQYSLYSNFGLIEPDGEVICSGLPLTTPVNIADRAFFQDVLKTRDFALSDYQIGRLTGKPVLSFGYPVLDDKGEVQAVFSGGFDLVWFNRLAAEIQLPPGAVFTVIDRQGTILARHPEPERWVGQSLPETPLIQKILAQSEGTAEVAGVDGIPRLYAFQPMFVLDGGGGNSASSESVGAYVSIGIPTEVAFAEVNQGLIRHLLGLSLVGLLALAAAWCGGNIFILRQVETLVKATKRLSSGDLEVRIDPPHDSSELGQLAQAFDEMAETLQRRELENRQAQAQIIRQAARAEALVASAARLNAQLEATNQELARSNVELQHFAYIASHDLQEPLRMVTSYTQLLARRYRGKLDSDADDFIGYAVDGISRMQRLINDLLAYSRIGTQGKPLKSISSEEILRQALANLQVAIVENNASITYEVLHMRHCR